MRLLKFSQNNCVPCKVLEGFIERELGTKADENHNISFGEDKTMKLVFDYGVMTTPALVLTDDEYNHLETVTGVDEENVRAIFQKRGLI